MLTMSEQRRTPVVYGPQPAEPEEIVEVRPPLAEPLAQPALSETLPSVETPGPLPAPAAETLPAEVSAEAAFDAYRSLVRLLVGGAVEGSAELTRRLDDWETRLNVAKPLPALTREEETPVDLARYALVGAAFDGAEFLREQFPVWQAMVEKTAQLSGKAARPFVRNRFTGFVGRWWDSAVGTGEKNFQRWIEIGRAEEPRSRALARTGVQDVINDIVSYLAENPEVADLVQQQSVGLAGEVVEEVRAKTVSADVLAENLVRKLLRRPARADFPAPPADIQELVAPPAKGPGRRG
jgi:hypothetical protein